MTSGFLSDDWFSFYKGSFQRDAHQLLAWGYEATRSKIRSDHLEEEITGLLIDGIKKRLNNTLTPARFRRYTVHEDEYARHTTRLGRRRQRIDIVVESSFRLPRPEFMFEAKVLKRPGFTIGRYTGRDGMQCYIRSEYAATYPVAAMIGYIQTDGPDYWYGQLHRKLGADKKKDLSVVVPLQQAKIIDSLRHEWVSRHKRENSDDIDIFHVFLNFLA
jgi:hypothetical protein